MKTYQEVVHLLGQRMFSRYMSGCDNHPGYASPTWLVGEIYDVNAQQVQQDVDQEYQRIKSEFYKAKA